MGVYHMETTEQRARISRHITSKALSRSAILERQRAREAFLMQLDAHERDVEGHSREDTSSYCDARR